MPKERFLNLPLEKRQRILAAAIDQLNKVSFEELSINQIIKQADIPRGSFYQYFEDKNDLLAFIMKDYVQSMRQNIRISLTLSGGDLFQVFADALRYTLHQGQQTHSCTFFKNVFAGLPINPQHIFDFGTENLQRGMDAFYPMINLDQFQNPTKQQVFQVANMLQILFRAAVAKAFFDPQNTPLAEEEFLQQIQIIKQGVLRPKEMEITNEQI